MKSILVPGGVDRAIRSGHDDQPRRSQDASYLLKEIVLFVDVFERLKTHDDVNGMVLRRNVGASTYGKVQLFCLVLTFCVANYCFIIVHTEHFCGNLRQQVAAVTLSTGNVEDGSI